MSAAPLSNTEVYNVQDGIAHDVREDGRSRIQQRRPRLRVLQTSPSSRLEVDVCGTIVVASASPSVIEVGESLCRGQLHITADMAPCVTDTYGATLGGRQRRYWRAYTAYVAQAVRQTFDAESVEVREVEGVASALLAEESDGEDVDGGGGGPPTAPAGRSPVLAQLYIGRGYAFRVHVDVHVLQAAGGNVPGVVSQAVHAALTAMRLPAVTLHEGAAGVSAEVDVDRPYERGVDWTRLPVLCVLLLSPTRHYVVDPTLQEEMALPQHGHIAANAQGLVSYAALRTHPSRRGNHDRLVPRGCACPAEVPMTDWLALLRTGVHVCQSMAADCREALHDAA